jgi:hypothetical protein
LPSIWLQLSEMSPDIFSFEIKPERLPDCRDEILELSGYSTQSGDAYISETLDDLLEESSRYMEIRCGYRSFTSSDLNIEKNNIHCSNVIFNSGSTISKPLIGCTELIVFAVTLGEVFDNWVRGLFSGGDPFAGYLADLTGTVRVEQAADWLEKQISYRVSSKKQTLSNRFSPGYCGWDVSEQHILFRLLPENFLGIRLNESALMIPIKSISGIIGIGKNVKREKYTCKLCDKTDCFMRRTKAQKPKKEYA